MYATYFVPQQNAPRLKDKIEKLSRKAVKLGCAAIMISLAKVFSAPHPDRNRAAAGERVIYEALTIQGDPPRLNGWVFVATLEHHTKKDGTPVTILRSHGEEALPARFRDATPDQCDHCQTNRRRNNTYVVRNEDTGEWAQVGRQCLKDFLGTHKDPGALARYASHLLELDDLLRGECGGCGGGGWVLDLVEFLAWTVKAIDRHGWTSRTVAREQDTMATADVVWLHQTAPTERARKAWDIPAPTDETYNEVAEAIAWVMGEDSTESDYIHNLQMLVELEAVVDRAAGYAASIIASFRRAKSRRLRQAVLEANGRAYVGTVGKREQFNLTLLGVNVIDGYYGRVYLHRFADTDGNPVVWWASNPDVVPAGAGHQGDHRGITADKCVMVPGASYRVTATVKDHGTYRDAPQTKITRLKVEPMVKVRKARKPCAKKTAGGVSDSQIKADERYTDNPTDAELLAAEMGA